jgi:hypothetical protein
MDAKEKRNMIVTMFIIFFMGGIIRTINLSNEIVWLRGIPQIMLALTFLTPILFFLRSQILTPQVIPTWRLIILLVALFLIGFIIYFGISSYFPSPT